jgi:hypothetical protein
MDLRGMELVEATSWLATVYRIDSTPSVAVGQVASIGRQFDVCQSLFLHSEL